jgi:hypothetical protein
VHDLESDFRSTPSVLETGLDYYKNLGPKLSTNWRVYYRDEEDVVSMHAFLAGEDSLEGSFSLSYFPYDGVQLFLDGRMRRIWPQKGSGIARSTEADLRVGTRLEWDSFFAWSPNVRIEGVIFKDVNSNSKQDADEVGLEGIKVKVGPHIVASGKDGKYKASVRARSVVVTLDVNTMPKGYVLTTKSSVRVDTSRAGTKVIDFGLSSQSGVYGLVFHDANNDGKFTPAVDKPIGKARVALDGKRTSVTNSEGSYFFGGLLQGKYTLSLDVNSLPAGYVPAKSIRQSLEVEEGATHAVLFPLKQQS